jgi:hypothetical protein
MLTQILPPVPESKWACSIILQALTFSKNIFVPHARFHDLLFSSIGQTVGINKVQIRFVTIAKDDDWLYNFHNEVIFFFEFVNHVCLPLPLIPESSYRVSLNMNQLHALNTRSHERANPIEFL